MDLYSRATGLVEQGGSRRGALMLQIEDWHPDIWRFIEVKKTPGMVENANISIRVSNDFMEAVKADGEWNLVFPDPRDPEYDQLWDGNLEKWKALGKPVVHYETVKARQMWDAIIRGAWQAAEPGVVFDQRHEQDSNSWYFNPLICTNPCAEQPLPAWGVCTLGHINLAAFYHAERQDVDWEALRASVRIGVRFLDDIVDATPYFFDENRENQQRERRIGLGTMGLGELLIRLGYRYGSTEAIAFIEKLYRFVAVEAYLYDVELAKEKGPFPAFDAEKYVQSGFIQRLPSPVIEAIRRYGTRNVTILTQAPTGTVGTMVGTSTGIEPFYALTYFRQSRLGFDEQYVPVAEEWRKLHPGEALPDYFVGAMDLTPEEHVYVQAAIQKWTDSSISKTANAPQDYTLEDTAKLYELAYDLGCKGVTIYRDQSRQEQVLHLTDDSSAAETAVAPQETAAAIAPGSEVFPVPSEVEGKTFRKETPAGTARVVINEVAGDPFEVFMLLGRAGSEVQSFMESLGRIISLYLRSSGDLNARRKLALVAEQLRGIGGANQMGYGAGRVLSVVDGIGQILNRYLTEEPQSVSAPEGIAEAQAKATRGTRSKPAYDLCPQCEAPTLIYEEGCQHCTGCGYSKC
jgi:ribonucleoside-diphosphate reductase alpha chain